MSMISVAKSLDFPGEETSKACAEVLRVVDLNESSKDVSEDVSKESDEFLESELCQTPRRSSSLGTVAGSDEDLERSVIEPIGDSHPNPPILQRPGVAHYRSNYGHVRAPPIPPFYGRGHMISYPRPPQGPMRPCWDFNYGPHDFWSMPFRPPPFQVYYCPPMPIVDPTPARIVKQIDYYFSECNLARDRFLRYNMDSEGWVPISLIADFPRVKSLTRSIPFIIMSLRASNVVEFKENKIRKRDNWRYWLPPSLPKQET